MKRTLALAAALAFTVAACGDSGPTGPGGNDNELYATVAGDPFDAPAPTATHLAAQGLLTISGSQTSGGVTTVLVINILGVEGEDQYLLNPNFVGTFGRVTTSDGSVLKSWSTLLSPGSGSVTITTLTADRVAGNFQFTGQAENAEATGQVAVTSGDFDIEF